MKFWRSTDRNINRGRNGNETFFGKVKFKITYWSTRAMTQHFLNFNLHESEPFAACPDLVKQELCTNIREAEGRQTDRGNITLVHHKHMYPLFKQDSLVFMSLSQYMTVINFLKLTKQVLGKKG
jgi:hypothetical protein